MQLWTGEESEPRAEITVRRFLDSNCFPSPHPTPHPASDLWTKPSLDHHEHFREGYEPAGCHTESSEPLLTFPELGTRSALRPATPGCSHRSVSRCKLCFAEKWLCSVPSPWLPLKSEMSSQIPVGCPPPRSFFPTHPSLPIFSMKSLALIPSLSFLAAAAKLVK